MSNISKIKIKNADGTEKEYNVSDSNIGTKIGDLDELITEDKSNLVNAINEVSENASGNNFVDVTLDEYNAMETHDPDTYYNVIDDVQDTSVILNQIGDITQLTTEEKSNLVGAINEVAGKGGDASISVIDGIPVDLTGIYNTQVIGFDETQGKLVPMINVERTETVVPNAIVPAPWVAILGELTGDTTQPSFTLSEELPQAIVRFTTPYTLSEFTAMKVNITCSNRSVLHKIRFSKTYDFSVVEAEYAVEGFQTVTGTVTCDITNLIGTYYMEVEFNRYPDNTGAALTKLSFSA